jgi:hypothetical protein
MACTPVSTPTNDLQRYRNPGHSAVQVRSHTHRPRCVDVHATPPGSKSRAPRPRSRGARESSTARKMDGGRSAPGRHARTVRGRHRAPVIRSVGFLRSPSRRRTARWASRRVGAGGRRGRSRGHRTESPKSKPNMPCCLTAGVSSPGGGPGARVPGPFAPFAAILPGVGMAVPPSSCQFVETDADGGRLARRRPPRSLDQLGPAATILNTAAQLRCEPHGLGRAFARS